MKPSAEVRKACFAYWKPLGTFKCPSAASLVSPASTPLTVDFGAKLFMGAGVIFTPRFLVRDENNTQKAPLFANAFEYLKNWRPEIPLLGRRRNGVASFHRRGVKLIGICNVHTIHHRFSNATKK